MMIVNLKVLQFVSIIIYIVQLLLWDYLTTTNTKIWWDKLGSIGESPYSKKVIVIIAYHFSRVIVTLLYVVSGLFLLNTMSFLSKVLLVLYSILSGVYIGILLSDFKYLYDEDFKSIEEFKCERKIGKFTISFWK